ncbi:hypothetical protein LSH36_236g00004 [Paralvinella palmiformis]|uniref:Protein-lysine N-methyltransferase SMYD4 n=1 Tax=Paralvinella palmiformis TaxID=53620 RepID=A0AAD9JN94_9ANNE|nr:hypothetical protein LSH36_236g00004 [Paralvinella palmiformis]
MGTLSGYYSSVQKILARVTSNTLKKFDGQLTDEERFDYVMSLDFVKEAFQVAPMVEAKSASESGTLREKGNVCFQKKDYKEALSLYNKAVLRAPINGVKESCDEAAQCEEFVLALGNRSATLFKLKEYKRCLEDIKVALKYNYPKHLLYKLYDRQGRCYQELGQQEQAVTSFRKIADVISEAHLDEHKKEHIIRSVKRQIAAIEGTPLGEDLSISDQSGSSTSTPELRQLGILGDDDSLSTPLIAGQESKIYPNTADIMQIKYGADRGRYCVGTSDVKCGDVVMLEPPYISVLEPSHYDRRCYHCFKRIIVPMGCHNCMKVLYCCEDCREASWQEYHSYECEYLIPLLTSGTGSIAHLALRIILKTGLVKILKYKKNPFSDQPDASQSLFIYRGTYMGGYMGLYNLLTHANDRSRNDLFQFTVLAVYLLEILELVGFFPLDDSVDSRLRSRVGGILLRFLQIISCNGIEITEMHVANALQKSNPDTIGLGLFPTVSLLNHSCDPNLELIFYNDTCAVRAIQNINSGKEFCIDYGYLYYVTPKKQRQLSLAAQYFFDCHCVACVRDWTVKSNLKCDIPILKCTKCSAPLMALFLSNNNPLAEEQDPSQHQCRRCGYVQNPMDVYDKLQKSGLLFERAVDQARRWEIKRALPMLQHHLHLLDKHVCLPWKDYVTCVSTIKQCYRMEGNKDKNPQPL